MITLKWNTVSASDIAKKEERQAYENLLQRTGKGKEFLGWMEPENIASTALLEEISQAAARIRWQSQCVVVAGIGGSYLGARAVIEALSSPFPTNDDLRVVYAGNNLSEDYLADLLTYLDTVDYSIIVISKSGTTTETAVAFRLLQAHCEKKYGCQAGNRIVCITDKVKGALKTLAIQKNYPCFILPDDVGGRYSVLTPVGLLPIAVAGFDIQALVKGACDMKHDILEKGCDHDVVRYACHRNSLYRKGKTVEVMAAFDSKLYYFMEWWKQLYGESEGKEHKGIFPASVVYTTDLHSMGQFMQDGNRILMETFLEVKQPQHFCAVPTLPDSENLDQLNYLGGKRISEINRQACVGTILAHEDGGVPSISVEIERLDAYHLGQLIYFFEFACAISGYILNVNPFNQPGVEAYKKNMFALLEKPGYEEATQKIKERINNPK